MTIVVIAILALVVIGMVYAVSYNGLVNARQEVSDAWAVIDIELERRHALIPMLVHTVRESAAHEQALLADLVARERTAAAVNGKAAERSGPEHDLALAATAVVALRERYPALDSQANFLRLQHDLSITEDRIGAARRFHNLRVAELNRRTEAFPSRIVASRHRIAPGEYFGV